MKSVLNVCQVSAAYYPYPSGLSEHVHHLTKSLRQRGHHVEILTTNFPVRDSGNLQSAICNLQSAIAPQSPFPITRFGRAYLLPANKSYATVPLGFHMSGQVKRYLRSHDFDIVHIHGIFPPDISFWALHHSRSVTVITFHSVGFKTSRVAASLCHTVMHKWNRKLSGRIVESQAALRFTQPYFPGEYRLIPPGVDTDRFRPNPQSSIFNIQSSIFNLPSPSILFVGRLDERKGLAVLLRALPLVRQQIPDVRLAVVGTGPMEREAHRMVDSLGVRNIVEFKGFVSNEELPQHYSAADVYCSPALGGEAFGIVLLEAMASGTPAVASNIPGYNEVVRDGENGLLFPANDHQALAAALLRVLSDSDLRTRLAVSGLQRAEQHSWSRVAERIEQHYEELLRRS